VLLKKLFGLIAIGSHGKMVAIAFQYPLQKQA
jgi:hypothetical protein